MREKCQSCRILAIIDLDVKDTLLPRLQSVPPGLGMQVVSVATCIHPEYYVAYDELSTRYRTRSLLTCALTLGDISLSYVNRLTLCRGRLDI
jgi:hypothetical protein